MSYSLEQLASDIKHTLKADPGPAGRAAVCQHVEKALKDAEFVAKNLGAERKKTREVLYEDPDLGFCICAHVYEGAAESPAHDHGPSWAIYGQAVGETEMTEYKIVKKASGDEANLVEPVETYTMKPGMAKFYDVGAVHSPKREGPTKLIRIEGKNLDHVKRSNIKAA